MFSSKIMKFSFFLLLICIVVGSTYAEGDFDGDVVNVDADMVDPSTSTCPCVNTDEASKMFTELTNMFRQSYEEAMTKTPDELLAELMTSFEQLSFNQMTTYSLVELVQSPEKKCTILFLWDPKVVLKRIKIKADDQSYVVGVLYSVEQTQDNFSHVFNGKYKMVVDKDCDLSNGKVVEFDEADLMIRGKSVIKIVFPEISQTPDVDDVIQ